MLPSVQLEAECGDRPVPPRVPEQPRARGAGPAAAPLAAPPVRAADHQPRPRRRAARPAAAVRGVRRDQRVPRGGQRARGGALRLRGVAHLLTQTEQTHCSILITRHRPAQWQYDMAAVLTSAHSAAGASGPPNTHCPLQNI